MSGPIQTPRTRQQTRLRERYEPTAVVTGASSGIGCSCARYLAAAGFDLVVVTRHGDALRHLATEVERDVDTDVTIVVADLSASAGVDTVVSATAAGLTRYFVRAISSAPFGPLAVPVTWPDGRWPPAHHRARPRARPLRWFAAPEARPEPRQGAEGVQGWPGRGFGLERCCYGRPVGTFNVDEIAAHSAAVARSGRTTLPLRRWCRLRSRVATPRTTCRKSCQQPIP